MTEKIPDLDLSVFEKQRNMLQERFPEGSFPLLKMKTTGDRVLNLPLSAFSDKGIWEPSKNK